MKQTCGVSFPTKKNHFPTSAGKSMESATKPEPVRGAKEDECGTRCTGTKQRARRLIVSGRPNFQSRKTILTDYGQATAIMCNIVRIGQVGAQCNI